MRNRGKDVDVYNDAPCGGGGDPFADYYDYDDGNGDGDGSPGLPCRKHPGASSVGICAYCLEDRLVKLVCSDCGEQRLSSCSCSDNLSSNRNSCTVEVGSVSHVSFLIENEKCSVGELPCSNTNTNSKARVGDKPPPDRVVLLKRSSSSCVEIKKTNGIWKIGRLFRRRKQKGVPDKNDSKSEMWVVDDGQRGGGAASRCRSLNSFRGCGVFGSEDSDWNFSGARSSMSGARASSVNGTLLFDQDRKSGFSEAEPRSSAFSEVEPRRSTFSEAEPRRSGLSETFTEPRKSGAFLDGFDAAACNTKPNRRIFSLRESDFTDVDEKGFIDLKFFTPLEAKSSELPSAGAKAGRLGSSRSASGSMRSINGFIGEGDFSGGSCRVTVTDWAAKKSSRRSFKGWRWVFGQYHPNWTRSSSKKKDQALAGFMNHLAR